MSMPESDPNRSQPSGGTTKAWVVVIEVMAPPDQPAYQFEAVSRLVDLLEEWRATGLFCADRYAVQVEVRARGHADALRLALARHDQAVDDLGLARPSFLRAEVLTPELLREDWLNEDAGPTPDGPWRSIPTAVYDAARAMVRATTVGEVRDLLARFVAEAGGSVTIGTTPPQPGMPGMPGNAPGMVVVDIGISAGEHLCASAEALSVGGMLIELWLPAVVEDARCAFERLSRQADRDRR
jgi:hypothetical protein